MNEPQVESYTYEGIVNDIIAFNNDQIVQRLRNIYYNQNLPEIFAVSRRELSHSSFLAWLFTSSANHGFGVLPLNLLLELFILKGRHKGLLSDKLTNVIITRSFHISECSAVTEESVTTKKTKGRADIVLTCNVDFPDQSLDKLKIVIENKVYSDEHSSQTQTYFDYYESIRSKNESVLYVFLTPPTVASDAECEQFVHITYQDLLDHIFEPLRRQPDINQRTKFILDEYINSLSIPSHTVEENSSTHIQTSILAIGMEEKELLQSFWEKHNRLIIAALNAMSGDNDEAKKLINNLSKKDFTKYKVNGEGPYYKRRMVEAVVNLYLKEHQDSSLDDLKSVFPDELQGGSLGVIRTTEDTIKDKTRYFESIHPKTNVKFFISNQWGPNIENFVNHVNTLNIGIHIEKC